MKLTNLLLATVVFATVGIFSAAGADRDKGRGERGGFSSDRRPQGGGGRTQFMQKFMQNMSEEGRRAMMEAFKEIRTSGQDLQQKITRLKKELAGMITSGEVDEKGIRGKVMAIAEIEADMTIMRARMFAKMKEAGVPEETLKLMASRMGGSQQVSMRGGSGAQGGEGMRRGGFGSGREGVEGRRPDRGAPKEGDAKKRRPEFEQ